jgi:uncharacterized membrane protein
MKVSNLPVIKGKSVIEDIKSQVLESPEFRNIAELVMLHKDTQLAALSFNQQFKDIVKDEVTTLHDGGMDWNVISLLGLSDDCVNLFKKEYTKRSEYTLVDAGTDEEGMDHHLQSESDVELDKEQADAADLMIEKMKMTIMRKKLESEQQTDCADSNVDNLIAKMKQDMKRKYTENRSESKPSTEENNVNQETDSIDNFNSKNFDAKRQRLFDHSTSDLIVPLSESEFSGDEAYNPDFPQGPGDEILTKTRDVLAQNNSLAASENTIEFDEKSLSEDGEISNTEESILESPKKEPVCPPMKKMSEYDSILEHINDAKSELIKLKEKKQSHSEKILANNKEMNLITTRDELIRNRLKKTFPLLESTQNELTQLTVQIQELVKKQELVSRHLKRMQDDFKRDTKAVELDKSKCESLAEQNKVLAQEISQFHSRIEETEDYLDHLEQSQLRIIETPELEFFDYHGEYFLVPSDLPLLSDLVKPTEETPNGILQLLRSQVQQKFHKGLLCGIEAVGGSCTSSDCKDMHIKDLSKSEDERLYDIIKEQAELSKNVEPVYLDELKEIGILNFLETKANFRWIKEVVFPNNVRIMPNFGPMPVKFNVGINGLNVDNCQFLLKTRKRARYYAQLDPTQIEDLLSHISSRIPPTMDPGALIDLLPELERAVQHHPNSLLLWSVYCEIGQFSNRSGEIFGTALKATGSLQILWIQYRASVMDERASLLHSIVDCCLLETKNSIAERSYSLLNALVNILRIDENGIKYLFKLFGDRENIILSHLLPLHLCVLLLCFIVVLKKGRLPSQLFYDSPHHDFIIPKVFLINYSPHNANNTFIDNLLIEGIDRFRSARCFDLYTCLVRNRCKMFGGSIDDHWWDLFAFEGRAEMRLLKLFVFSVAMY